MKRKGGRKKSERKRVKSKENMRGNKSKKER